MDTRICICSDGGTVSVQGPDYGATFGRGAHVDWSARVAPNVNVTWGQALERYAHLFESPAAATPAPQPAPSRTRASRTTPPPTTMIDNQGDDDNA